MKALKILVVFLLLAALACSEESKGAKGMAIPDGGNRSLPANTPPDEVKYIDADVPDVRMIPDQVWDCCNVTFNIADDFNDEVSARLKGSDEPLDGEGVELTYIAGRWTADVCMPVVYDGTYYYEFGYEVPETGGVYIETGTNEFVEAEDDGLRDANLYPAVTSCNEVSASHSQYTD